MKIVSLKSGHIQIYKRENSKFWQMKLKYPKEKAIRLSTGTKILNDAKKIALDQYYNEVLKNEKEEVKVNSTDLLKEFEKEADKLDKARKGDMAKKLW